MIATGIEKKDLISEFGGAPKVITSDAQHERYVSMLLELERRESGGQLQNSQLRVRPGSYSMVQPPRGHRQDGVSIVFLGR